jgi:diadenosine tetraphosphatase ApaH/serine/threonine PP2A family protein phosphatase
MCVLSIYTCVCVCVCVCFKLFNQTFDHMPFAATIDERVFCCHGGIPRALNEPDQEPLLQRIANIVRPASEEELEADVSQLAMDLMWADPATADEEAHHAALLLQKQQSPRRRAKRSNNNNHHDDDNDNDNDTGDLSMQNLALHGFAPNRLRGGDAVVFGTAAVDKFVQETGLTHMIRAHQPPEMGIEYAKGARILTVFSSSHYCGDNSAAVIMAARGELKVATSKQQRATLTATTSQYFVV